MLLQPDHLLGTTVRPDLDVELLGEEGAPYRVRTDARGLRADPHPDDRDRLNILALGDSFLFGSGVNAEDAMAARLHRMLDEKFPGRLRVVNAGAPGYATNQELVYFLERGHAAFRPRLVLVFFYVNDVTLGGLPDDKIHFYPLKIPVPLPNAADRPRGFAGVDWRMPRFARWLLQKNETAAAAKPADAGPKTVTIRGTEPSMFYKPFRDSRLEVINLNVKRIFAMMDEQVRARNARLMVVILPSPLESEDGRARQNYYRNYTPDRDAWDWSQFNSDVVNALNEVNISYVNLLPVFRRHWDMTGRTLYFNGDGHFTAEGHDVAAHAIFPALESYFH